MIKVSLSIAVTFIQKTSAFVTKSETNFSNLLSK